MVPRATAGRRAGGGRISHASPGIICDAVVRTTRVLGATFLPHMVIWHFSVVTLSMSSSGMTSICRQRASNAQPLDFEFERRRLTCRRQRGKASDSYFASPHEAAGFTHAALGTDGLDHVHVAFTLRVRWVAVHLVEKRLLAQHEVVRLGRLVEVRLRDV